MARFKVNQFSDYPYHITGRRTNRDPFPLSMDETWNIFANELHWSTIKHDLRIQSFTLMPNHYHLMAQVTKTPIGTILCEMLTNISKEINRRSGRVNQVFGGRHYKCELTSPIYAMNCYKYIQQNPVRAGLVTRAEAWPYSTLHGLLGLSKLSIPLVEDSILFDPELSDETLEWINRPIRPDHLLDFRMALAKRRFRLPRRQNLSLRHPLETDQI